MGENKKAQVGNWIVLVIILIAGFAILIYFLSNFLWVQNIDKEVCHQSVIIRGSLSSLVQNYAPLKCKTTKYCLASGNGKCEESFGKASDVAVIKVQTSNDIDKFLSREMVDCWTMMGNGKILLFSDYWAKNGLGESYPSCVICDRIAFDKDLRGKNIVEKANLWEYMNTHRVPETDKSYVEFFGGQTGNIKSEITLNVPNEVLKLKTGSSAGITGGISVVPLTDSIPANANYADLDILFMQISNPGTWKDVLKNDAQAAGLIWGGSFVISPTKTFTLTKAVTGWYTAALAAIFVGYQLNSVSANQGISASYCGDISVGQNTREGCSVIRTVNHNAEEIGQYCKVVESMS